MNNKFVESWKNLKREWCYFKKVIRKTIKRFLSGLYKRE